MELGLPMQGRGFREEFGKNEKKGMGGRDLFDVVLPGRGRHPRGAGMGPQPWLSVDLSVPLASGWAGIFP